jgi:hypothetical protein
LVNSDERGHSQSALHNVFSQAIAPRTLGAGDELLLGESGIFPVAAYLFAAAIVLLR